MGFDAFCVESVECVGVEEIEENVIVAPLGWERSRVVDPAIRLRAHRVHLLTRPDFRRSDHFRSLVIDDLQAAKIEAKTHAIEPTREFESLVASMSRIVVNESKERNRVHVNASGSSKVAAAAASLVCSYQVDRVASLFYVEPLRYLVEADDVSTRFVHSGLTEGVSRMYYLPVFAFGRTSPDAEAFLAYLYEQGPVDVVASLRWARERRIPGFEQLRKVEEGASRDLSKWAARLKRGILSELTARSYLATSTEPGTRKARFALTDLGRHAAMLTGLLKRL